MTVSISLSTCSTLSIANSDRCKAQFRKIVMIQLSHAELELASIRNRTDGYRVLSPYKEESEKVFGTYKSVFKDGLYFICDEHTTGELIESYIDYLKD